MPVEERYPWAALRFELLANGLVRARWRDESSAAWSPGGPPGSADVGLPLPPELDGIGSDVFVAYDVTDALRRGSPAAPLAVFLDAPAPFRGLPLEALAARIISFAEAEASTQSVRWLRRKPSRHRPFRLPLRVATVGEVTAELDDRLLSSSWYAADAVADFGFQLEHLGSPGKRLRETTKPLDVIVAAGDAVAGILRAAARGTPPRLVVALLESRSPRPAWLATVPIPAGTSVAWFGDSPSRGVAAAESLIYALTHDQPLHAAVREAASWNEMPPHLAGLVSDPAANQSLRISEALTTLLADVDTLALPFDAGDVQQFVTRLSPDEQSAIEEPLRMASSSATPLRDAMATTRRLAVTFDRETAGLVPIAQHRALLEVASHGHGLMRDALAELASDPHTARIVRSHQRRTVDIAVQRAVAPSAEWAVSHAPPFLTRDTVLRAGSEYRIRVHAGTPTQESIVRGERPGLDPLLPDAPDARGHLLEFVVFGHDFEVLSETRQERYLPLLGGTEPAYFDVRAPSEPIFSDAEPLLARARIAVYYQGNLLQSFLMHALVGPDEWQGSDEALGAELEFSQSRRLSNLDDILPRDLSIAVNKSPDGSHRLMLHGTEDEGDVRFTEQQIDRQTKAFRDTLLDATFSDVASETQRFDLAEPPNWDELDRYVRALARAGSDLHDGIFTPPLRKLLTDVGTSADKSIQVVFYNTSLAFPWAALYDRTPPRMDVDVCYGGATRAELEAGAPLEFRCGHGYLDEVFCVFGFWGVRHLLDYRLAGHDEPVPTLEPKPGGKRVCLAIGEVDEFTRVVVDDLTAEFGAPAVHLLDREDPLDVLWSDERPVEVVVIGHLDIPEDAPNDPSITLIGDAQVLRNKDLMKKVKGAEWSPPNSLVLLMACGSVADDVRTLVTMLKSFTDAPAAAVVGTEAPVVESLVSHFASRLSLEMWRDGKSLGHALTSVRRTLIASGNPLGFAFSAYGNADLRIVT